MFRTVIFDDTCRNDRCNCKANARAELSERVKDGTRKCLRSCWEDIGDDEKTYCKQNIGRYGKEQLERVS